MNVVLTDFTKAPETMIASYAAICYDSDTSFEANERRIKHLLKNKHLATLRFAYATFKVEDISRACSHQLVRAKHLDFLQESQRYVNQENCSFVWPEDFVEVETLEKAYRNLYNNIIEAGAKKEDARYVLPNATATSLYVTGNFQAWKDFLKNRLDITAQWEIRKVAQEILKHLNNIAPNIFPVEEQ